jgi:hypothetical protein
MAVCSLCGKQSTPTGEPAAQARPDDELPLTWMTSLERGQTRVYCDECARAHVRSIESKLDSEWW